MPDSIPTLIAGWIILLVVIGCMFWWGYATIVPLRIKKGLPTSSTDMQAEIIAGAGIMMIFSLLVSGLIGIIAALISDGRFGIKLSWSIGVSSILALIVFLISYIMIRRLRKTPSAY